MKELLDQIDTLTASFLKDACSQLDKGSLTFIIDMAIAIFSSLLM